ncbi:MAG: hypothetical protein AAF125_00270 [Chloroflexota bacterium]
MRFIAKNWGLLLGLIVFILVVGFGTSSLLQQRPQRPDTVSGTIAFRTNRDGNFEIYSWAVNDRKADRITINDGEDANPSYNNDGSLLAFESWSNEQPDIIVADAVNGVGNPITTDLAWDTEPDWSPDSARLVFVSDRGETESLYLVNRDSTGLIRVTGDEGRDTSPAWSPDGTTIVFVSNRGGTNGIYSLAVNSCVPPAEGSPPLTPQTCTITPIIVDGADNTYPDWSPDGERIAFASTRDGGQAIYALRLRNNRVDQLTQGPLDSHPAYSPEGGRIVYTDGASGNDELFVYDIVRRETEQITNNRESDGHGVWRPAPPPAE